MRLSTKAILMAALALGGCDRGSTGTADAAGIPPECHYPRCLEDLAQECAPAGACTMQANATTTVVNYCFSNEVKILRTGDGTTRRSRVMKGGRLCYSVESPVTGSTFTITYRNGAGQVIATSMVDPGPFVSVACEGQAPVQIPRQCGSPDDVPRAGAGPGITCPTGACM
jgi:hypothetical protein